MVSALLVLNAGSSSLKFSVFRDAEVPELLVRGQLDGLFGRPRFVARSGDAVVARHEWPEGTELGHAGAIDHLFGWGRSGVLAEHRIVAVGHRVVHGGTRFAA